MFFTDMEIRAWTNTIVQCRETTTVEGNVHAIHTKQTLFHSAIPSPSLPCIFSIFILTAFTLDLLCWIEGPIRSDTMLTSPIRALQGPYQVRVPFAWGTATAPIVAFLKISVVSYWTEKLTSLKLNWKKEVCVNDAITTVWKTHTQNRACHVSEQIKHQVYHLISFLQWLTFTASFKPQRSNKSARANSFLRGSLFITKYHSEEIWDFQGQDKMLCTFCSQDLCPFTSDLSHWSSVSTRTINSVQSLVLTSKDNPLNGHMLKSATLLLCAVRLDKRD